MFSIIFSIKSEMVINLVVHESCANHHLCPEGTFLETEFQGQSAGLFDSFCQTAVQESVGPFAMMRPSIQTQGHKGSSVGADAMWSRD